MNIKISSEECMCCKSKESITNHHAIPQRMNPKQNVEIPLCNKCHKQLHANHDNVGLKLHIRKQFKILQGLIDRTFNKQEGKK